MIKFYYRLSLICAIFGLNEIGATEGSEEANRVTHKVTHVQSRSLQNVVDKTPRSRSKENPQKSNMTDARKRTRSDNNEENGKQQKRNPSDSPGGNRGKDQETGNQQLEKHLNYIHWRDSDIIEKVQKEALVDCRKIPYEFPQTWKNSSPIKISRQIRPLSPGQVLNKSITEFTNWLLRLGIYLPVHSLCLELAQECYEKDDRIDIVKSAQSANDMLGASAYREGFSTINKASYKELLVQTKTREASYFAALYEQIKGIHDEKTIKGVIKEFSKTYVEKAPSTKTASPEVSSTEETQFTVDISPSTTPTNFQNGNGTTHSPPRPQSRDRSWTIPEPELPPASTVSPPTTTPSALPLVAMMGRLVSQSTQTPSSSASTATTEANSPSSSLMVETQPPSNEEIITDCLVKNSYQTPTFLALILDKQFPGKFSIPQVRKVYQDRGWLDDLNSEKPNKNMLEFLLNKQPEGQKKKWILTLMDNKENLVIKEAEFEEIRTHLNKLAKTRFSGEEGEMFLENIRLRLENEGIKKQLSILQNPSSIQTSQEARTTGVSKEISDFFLTDPHWSFNPVMFYVKLRETKPSALCSLDDVQSFFDKQKWIAKPMLDQFSWSKVFQYWLDTNKEPSQLERLIQTITVEHEKLSRLIGGVSEMLTGLQETLNKNNRWPTGFAPSFYKIVLEGVLQKEKTMASTRQ